VRDTKKAQRGRDARARKQAQLDAARAELAIAKREAVEAQRSLAIQRRANAHLVAKIERLQPRRVRDPRELDGCEDLRGVGRVHHYPAWTPPPEWDGVIRCYLCERDGRLCYPCARHLERIPALVAARHPGAAPVLVQVGWRSRA
jgi:hypothetical protein